MSLKNKLISAIFGKLQNNIVKFKTFFKKPAVLTALKIAALAAMIPLLSWLKKLLEKKIASMLNKSADKALNQIKDTSNITDDDVNNYVKNNRDLQHFLNYIGKDTDESLVSNVVLGCSDPNYYEKQMTDMMTSLGDADLTADDFLKITQNQSDMDLKVDAYRVSKNLSDLLAKINGILPWVFMVYIIILKIKEFMTQNEYPSVYRGKYIQRLIRTISAVLKERLRSEGKAIQGTTAIVKETIKEEKAQIEKIFSTLKILDSIIVASLLASFVYLRNRKILQKESLIVFSDVAKTQSCINAPIMLTDDETTPATIPYNQTPAGSVTIAELLACPINTDDYIVPHEPIEDKLQNFSCEIVLNQDGSINEGSREDLATKALFENKTTKMFNILVKTGDTINVSIPMAIYDGSIVYPSLNGIVEKIEPNKVFVKDITEPNNSGIENSIIKFQDLYKEQNDTKFFLKDFYLPSFYPVMLKESPLIDNNLSTEEKERIIYTEGGVIARWDAIIVDFKNQTKDWEKRSKLIAGPDNVKTKAEAEQIDLIQKEMDDSEKTLFKYLILDAGRGISESRVTKPDVKEFTLIEYYFSLLQSLVAYFDNTNSIATAFIKKINEILINRYFVDKYSIQKIKDKINGYCKTLSEGTYFEVYPDFYIILKTLWEQLKAQPGESFTSGESYLKDLGKNNTVLSEEKKTALRKYILFLFNFSLVITNLIETKYAPVETKFELTALEGIWIQGYFDNLWKRYNDLPGEIDSLLTEINNISQVFESYSIINIDGEEYRWYTIDEELCEMPDEDAESPYLSPKSRMKYSNKKYWLRYCAFATLASVINPVTGWSTGFPPPLGPIPFPTVYIPIKPFQMKWGIIVLGITITGIYPFPWVLFVNWSSQNHVPLADPVTMIQREVDALKKEITKQIKSFKKITIKSFMDKAKIDVDNTTAVLVALNDERTVHKLTKPKRKRTLTDPNDSKKEKIMTGVENTKAAAEYVEVLATWTTNGTAIAERILIAKRKKFIAETKYKILKDAYDGAPVTPYPDPKIQALENTEKNFASQFDKLDLLVEKMDNFLAPLPINTKPETANFAFTIKNPKPVIQMGKDIDQTIDDGVLDKIIEKFELKNENLMSSNYKTVLNQSFNNVKTYKSTLTAAMPNLITADPFPKFENMRITNLPWMAFLFKSWAPVGAKTYGFPGQIPLPI